MGQVDQKPTYFTLRPTEIPYLSRAEPQVDKSKGTEPQKELERDVQSETTHEVDPPLHRVKQETRKVAHEERPFESEELTADEVLKIVEHDSFEFFRGSSIPLSTDFAERVLPLISNQMGPAPSRFRHNNQERTTRTLANENEISINGSTDDPTHLSAGSIGNEVGKEVNQVSTIREEGLPNIITPPINW